MLGEIIWFSPNEKIGYVLRDGTRHAGAAPIMYFFNAGSFPEIDKLPGNPVGQKVTFDTMFHSKLDEDVVKTMRLL